MDPIQALTTTFWFFLPAYAANCTPVVVSKIKSLPSHPLDLYFHYNGSRLLGDNKTWRGFVSGVVVAIIVCYLQRLLYLQSSDIQNLSVFDYQYGNSWALGGLLGVGALTGDAVKSFFKRRRGIKNGDPWIFWDQVDQVIGASVFALPLVILPSSLYVWALVLTFLLVVAVNHLAYGLGLKSVPW